MIKTISFVGGLTSIVILFLAMWFNIQQGENVAIETTPEPTQVVQEVTSQTGTFENLASGYENPFSVILTDEQATIDNTIFPIIELGNCENAEACYTYCLVPRNTPACWSYGTYNLHKNVLGVSSDETPVIMCEDDPTCKSYCQSHPDECAGFAPSSGSTEFPTAYLGPQGCRTQAECALFCQAHPSHCPQFPFDSSLDIDNNEIISPDSNQTVVCTQEAKQCPDGSFVSRQPPTCDFTPCP